MCRPAAAPRTRRQRPAAASAGCRSEVARCPWDVTLRGERWLAQAHAHASSCDTAAGAAAGGLHGLGQRGSVVGAVVAPAVDEERRRAGHAALVGARHVPADARLVLAAAQLLDDALR